MQRLRSPCSTLVPHTMQQAPADMIQLQTLVCSYPVMQCWRLPGVSGRLRVGARSTSRYRCSLWWAS
jgi:hypothetical protein